MKPKKKLLVVAALFLEKGRIFLAQRGAGQSSAGCWELPGGKVETGEQEQEALQREIEEELAGHIIVGDFWRESVVELEDVSIQMRVYRCKRSSEFVLSEHQSMLWADSSQLAVLRFAPADVPLIPELLQLLNSGDCRS